MRPLLPEIRCAMPSHPPTSSPTRPAFTLVEILVAVGIIILLLAILVPALSRVHASALKTVAMAQLGALQAGLQQYYTDFNTYPPSAPAYGGIPANRGSVMLAQGLMGFLDFNADGAGPSNNDPAFGFRTQRNAAMGGGRVYGPYATADAKIYKINSATDQTFVDPWDHEILYYCSTRAPVPAQIFGGGGTSSYFNAGDCSATSGAASPNAAPAAFFSLITNGASNTVTSFGTGAVTGASSYLLISAGYDGKYFTADDLVVGK